MLIIPYSKSAFAIYLWYQNLVLKKTQRTCTVQRRADVSPDRFVFQTDTSRRFGEWEFKLEMGQKYHGKIVGDMREKHCF